MRESLMRWSMLAWLVLWLGVIAPGHTRGMIRTDSAKNRGKAACCASHKSESDNPKPSKDEAARHCALCYLNASLDLPITIDLTAHLTGLLERTAPQPAALVYVAAQPMPITGRGPPAVAL